MIISDIKKFICKKDIPLIDAIKKIDQGGKGILFKDLIIIRWLIAVLFGIYAVVKIYKKKTIF